MRVDGSSAKRVDAPAAAPSADRIAYDTKTAELATNDAEWPRIEVKDLTEHHPTYFLAAVVAVLTAVLLRLVGVPNPWPAAIALYVYGTVAWPVLRDRMPLKPTLYAAVWMSVALLVIAYETLAAYAGAIG
jgi:hypothetical protein